MGRNYPFSRKRSPAVPIPERFQKPLSFLDSASGVLGALSSVQNPWHYLSLCSMLLWKTRKKPYIPADNFLCMICRNFWSLCVNGTLSLNELHEVTCFLWLLWRQGYCKLSCGTLSTNTVPWNSCRVEDFTGPVTNYQPAPSSVSGVSAL